MIFSFFFNSFIHLLAAFSTSPNAIIAYFPYFAPLLAVIIALFLTDIFKKEILNKKKLSFLLLFLFICFSIPSLREATIFRFPSRKPDLIKINQSAKKIKEIIPEGEKVVWLANPMTLYLAGRRSYFPLINHVNFYRSDFNTQKVKKLGLWNEQMFLSWIKESNFVFLDPNKLKSLSQKAPGLVISIKKELEENFQLVETFDENFSPKNLIFFKRKKYFSKT